MKAVSVSLMAIAMLLGIPAAGTAEERKCRGTIRSKTLVNVKVPVGASCTLKSVKVKGTVKVGRNARLEAIRVRVVGTVQAENARQVIVRAGSKVRGSIQIVQQGCGHPLRGTSGPRAPRTTRLDPCGELPHLQRRLRVVVGHTARTP